MVQLAKSFESISPRSDLAATRSRSDETYNDSGGTAAPVVSTQATSLSQSAT